MAKKPTGAASETAGKRASTLVVAARVEGFRRAGRAWSRAETRLPADSLSDEDLAALTDEPMLSAWFEEEGRVSHPR
jgi:hypothetical protein